MESQQTSEVGVVVNQTSLATFKELWSRTWSFIGGNFWWLAGVMLLAAILSVPGIVGQFLVGFGVGSDWGDVNLYGLAIAVALVSIVSSVFLQLILIQAAAYGRSHTIVSMFKQAGTLFVPFAVTSMMAYGAMAVGFLLLIVPGIILSAYIIPITWVMVSEKLSYRTAVLRSIDLVRGRWWYVTWKISLALIVALLCVLGALLLALVVSPLFFTLFLLEGTLAIVLAAVTAGVSYITLIGLLTMFLMRFSYELYESLKANYLPHEKNLWWQNTPLKVMMVLGCVIGVAYVCALPFIMVTDARSALEDGLSDQEYIPSEAEAGFEEFLQENPDFLEKFDNPNSL